MEIKIIPLKTKHKEKEYLFWGVMQLMWRLISMTFAMTYIGPKHKNTRESSCLEKSNDWND